MMYQVRESSEDLSTEPMETILFTDIVSQQIGKAKVSELMPIMKHLGTEWSLKINKVKHFKLAKKLLINSIKYN